MIGLPRFGRNLTIRSNQSFFDKGLIVPGNIPPPSLRCSILADRCIPLHKDQIANWEIYNTEGSTSDMLYVEWQSLHMITFSLIPRFRANIKPSSMENVFLHFGQVNGALTSSSILSTTSEPDTAAFVVSAFSFSGISTVLLCFCRRSLGNNFAIA